MWYCRGRRQPEGSRRLHQETSDRYRLALPAAKKCAGESGKPLRPFSCTERVFVCNSFCGTRSQGLFSRRTNGKRMKVLLLTDMPPCTNYTAGLVLDQLCSFLPEGSLGCFSLLHPAHNPDIPERWHRIPRGERMRPRDDWGLTVRKESALSYEKYAWGRPGSSHSRGAQSALERISGQMPCGHLEGQKSSIRLAIPVAKRSWPATIHTGMGSTGLVVPRTQGRRPRCPRFYAPIP